MFQRYRSINVEFISSMDNQWYISISSHVCFDILGGGPCWDVSRVQPERALSWSVGTWGANLQWLLIGGSVNCPSFWCSPPRFESTNHWFFIHPFALPDVEQDRRRTTPLLRAILHDEVSTERIFKVPRAVGSCAICGVASRLFIMKFQRAIKCNLQLQDIIILVWWYFARLRRLMNILPFLPRIGHPKCGEIKQIIRTVLEVQKWDQMFRWYGVEVKPSKNVVPRFELFTKLYSKYISISCSVGIRSAHWLWKEKS